MSAHTIHNRSNRDFLEVPSSQKSSSLSTLTHSSRFKFPLKSEMSEYEKGDSLLRSARTIRDLNSTYVISACKTTGDMPLTINPTERLTLQRRATRNKESSLLSSESRDTTEKTAEASLTLQRRAKTVSVEKWKTAKADSVAKWKTRQDVGSETESNCASQRTRTNVKFVNNNKNSFVTSSTQIAEDSKDAMLMVDQKYKTFSAPSGANENTLKHSSSSTLVGSQDQREAGGPGPLAAKPIQSNLNIKVSGTGNLHPSTGKDIAKNSSKFGSLDKRNPVKCMTEYKSTPKHDLPQLKSSGTSILKNRTPSLQVKQRPKSSLLSSKREISQKNTLPIQETEVQNTSIETDFLKIENSQVTVAVRVRPFSKREKIEKASQVVFMNGEEIIVEHPDMKQVYSFIYDVSFWSFDQCHPHYASQVTVYETLAAPLLERAFEGYNTCLFAYGQTGSGKSYTMMGFSEEPGIIPRFCEDLFAQVAKKQTQEVSYHFEMSFFEVYNEKIHDLLVCKGENGQRKQPLRVREHPVSGPFVEALSMNVISSYSDIQSWLELGNKQRATAATGMNDKSSRSHSVFTLVMTQTKTETVEGEEHDHRIISRINLVDLAGSERCSAAHTSEDRLKEGVSINKSLLTLGKVISALSEQANRKRVFIPYRESVLTWLLKESLGGNSKTAMIATISPAASNIEETLSTLRYANQARLIVNIARVNEDINAKLIRELKAEIEKLKAAQRNNLNIDPERYRLCRQEITSLRMKLHQQERDMAEMQRVWKEKFEQAEKRKRQETKELQKAGITFQMDNRLPNLVNLNEDPQLSEMLLYMIKEGTTTVGKNKPNSSHDIQLSGVLIADDHCTVRNFGGTVSIIPVAEAKTYVNGKHILEPTVLHHGDRVILGGDHYFRFNHPVEVQKGKRPSSRDTFISEGPKDFEFAKNELLMAQRSQLEAEIKEAQLKAKEEMMQGIQIAKEMAQQELSSQKAAYESKIQALEAELREESQRKKMQEISNQKASHKIEELEKTKLHLEQEVYVNKKRLEMETLATKQALEDHSIRHAKILEALETEKQKIAKEVQLLQQSRNNRGKTFTIQPSWSSMKVSMMIQEANTISSKLKKYYVFGRHDASVKGSSETSIRVRNLQLGVSTFWSLEKFESKLAAMKELYESNGTNRGEDVFCDPEDEWEPDITNAPVSSFSRRRSRSLMKNRRISDCLHDIQVHPMQNLCSSRSSGLMEKPSTIYSTSAESFLPGICKELIGSSMNFLGHSFDEEKTIADSLINNLLKIYNGLLVISKAHEEQDEESQDNLFSSDRAVQSCTVQIACSFEQLVVLIRHWLNDFLPCTCIAKLEDELRQEMKKLGGYLQLFLQGCCSDISSMVKEAEKKVIQIIQRAVKYVGKLAVLKGNKLYFLEGSHNKAANVQEEFIDAICDGVGSGMKILLDSSLEKAKELEYDLLRECAQNEVTKQMKANAIELVRSLENIFSEWKTKSFRTQVQEDDSGYQDSKKITDLALKLLKLKHCLEKAIQISISTLRGCCSDVHLLKNCVETICSLVSDICNDFSELSTSVDHCENKISQVDHRELESLAKSLLLCFESEERPDLLKPWESCNQDTGGGEEKEESNSGQTGCSRNKSVPKRVYELHEACPAASSEVCTPSRVQWV
ncbi:PREDICTED: kinesin-like protein KIF14 [Chinchilla lanigera]|uniref:Kinesin-like protein KIF14 n=1 Tax=Chinchilla lanigera TaxID=34839 RepID=A0A8C2VLI2_CHILA|nr:PREDICTED: kinesin-like protein KIF14 [Chinchilla lanigera]XP_013377485.1 PREDICTED: kinesin-like protein KIF14 [Chinchilla lanigera]XP_013377487.1 PREDICTED: kinesin-like protein KIF14 [Chinchilla lanigera]XP_013377490.1 PREDICTED: kinesin-like protein KIF14 [Chinchilla lanigera]XP_013377493.1 PREDICTED: kinesin-like protein KIF14 [Chinchilla lanigera]XP_013377496.1 PREDICTED: kinesin-like protein KIF14 [Chinchilla lanigera]